jgi:hypothetical protein
LIAIHQFLFLFHAILFYDALTEFFSYGDALPLSSSLCNVYICDNGQLNYNLAVLSWLIIFKK